MFCTISLLCNAGHKSLHVHVHEVHICVCILYVQCAFTCMSHTDINDATLLWYCPHMLSRCIFFSLGSTQILPCHTASGDNCTSSICPNTEVNYTCTITNGTAAGLTDWTLPTGTCTNNEYPDMIRLSQFVSTAQCAAQGSGVSSMCGPYRASSIQPSSGTNCLSSILTVSITTAMNGSTVTCNNTYFMSSASTVVSMATINVVGTPFICSHFCVNGFPDPSIAITISSGSHISKNN